MNGNAIERVLSSEEFTLVLKSREKSGTLDDTQDVIIDKMMDRHCIDAAHDDPLPNWAIAILRDPTIGYKWRIKIAFAHHYDITGINPSRFLVNRQMMGKGLELPDNPLLDDFRKKRQDIADQYIKMKGYA